MRTTINIPDAIMRAVYAKAGEEHRPLKDVITELISAGLNKRNPPQSQWTCPVYDLGGTNFDYTKAWKLIDDLEADAVAEKRDLRK
jgi:hypothetical protein